MIEQKIETTTVTLTHEELSKIITCAITAYSKGLYNKTHTQEEIDNLYSDTLSSLRDENLHGEFLEQYDDLLAILPQIEYMGDE